MKQIQMNKSKNLSEASIVSYQNKVQPFVDYCGGSRISAVTIDTVDGFTNHLVRCGTIFHVDGIDIPFVVASDKYSIARS